MLDSTMEITSYVGCPVQCKYCPQDKIPYSGVMSMETFTTCIDKIPGNVRIDLTDMSEFFCMNNTHSYEMLKYLKGRDVCIYTTLLDATEEHLEILKELNIVELIYHVPDKAMNDIFTPVNERFFKELKWDRAAMFTADIPGFANTALKYMNLAISPMHDRAGNCDVGTQYSGGPYCALSKNGKYSRNVLMPNGDVLLCCMDYSAEHVLGNLLHQTYESLFVGERYDSIVKQSEEIGFICRKCPSGSNLWV